MCVANLLRKLPASAHMVILVYGLLCMITEGNCFKCYQCQNAKSHEECDQPGRLMNCPNDASYDACIWKESQTESGYRISKECTKTPCSSGSNFIQVNDRACNKENASWECSHCCSSHHGCNKGSGSRLTTHILAVAPVALLALLLRSL